MSSIPDIRNITPFARRPSAEYIRALILAGDEDSLVERLALIAIDLLEQLRAVREVLRSTLVRLRECDALIDRQRETIEQLREQLRENVRPAA
jgi:hypothetical protein